MQVGKKTEVLKKIQDKLGAENIDFLYLSSFDHFLSEYVPLDDSFRVFLTEFTGSVAEALIPKEGKILLYVDGRYHEQADNECDLEMIEVVKVPFGTPLLKAMKEDLCGDLHLGILAKRTPIGLLTEFPHLKIKEIEEEKLFEEISFSPKIYRGPLWEVPLNYTGRTVAQRCREFIKKDEMAFINALDTLAWFSNLRGSHLPFQGTFRSVGMATHDALYLFVEKELMEYVEPFALENERMVFPLEQMQEKLKDLKSEYRPTKISYDKGSTNIYYFKLIEDIFEDSENHKGILQASERSFHEAWQAIKTPEEVTAFTESFEKSDQAIYDSLVWLIEQTRKGEKVSELQFRDKSNEIYKSFGARTQSFKTIAGFGANGSIIHYSSPSDKKFYQEGENVLMDSGAIYEQGLATDCTRTIVPCGRPEAEQVKNYTLVLKGLLALMMAKFPEGVKGGILDEISRGPLKEEGLNYGHGTGHGVGVNVHEAGFSIRPESQVAMRENTVGSIEPGCYVPGKAGIRLENIAHVRKDGDSLCFDSFVHIGFWPDLIDSSLLTDEEAQYLEEYEAECERRGRSFKRYAVTK